MATQNAATTKTAPAAKASAETLKPEAEKLATLPASKNVPEKEEPTLGVKITLHEEIKATPGDEKKPATPSRETLLKSAQDGTLERHKALSNLERIYATREELNRYKPGEGEPFEGSLTITGGGYGNSKFTTTQPDILEAAFELCRQKVEERVKIAENNLLAITTKTA